MRVTIDSSRCTSLVAGSATFDKNKDDVWYYKDVEFESGKIYGLVSEYGQGCMYLSYLLGGNVEFGDLQIYIDDKQVTKGELKEISWNLEPSKEKYKNKIVKKSIEKTITKNRCIDTFDDIAEAFFLTKERYSLKLRYLSGERWRASAALGYVSGKKIFYAPYECTEFYYSMNKSNLFKVLRNLVDNGAVVVLPVGSDVFMKTVVDECIYLDRLHDL